MGRVRFLMERAMPLRELSAEARREKAIRHGHISTLHVWWARRPLVVARAAVLGALLTDEADIAPDFVQNLCRWEVHDGDAGGRSLLEQARALVRQRFGSTPPKVLDSFAGGGSIPLEALRLGAQAFAVEYNPVAYLILKATIEFPQRFRQGIRDEGRGTKEEMHHEHSVISGPGNLEKGDAIGCSSVSPDQALPSEEMHGLTSQMRRAAVSVPTNIAEGWGRGSRKEYIQFLRIARGSLLELETLLAISRNLRYLSQEDMQARLALVGEISRMLSGLIASLKKGMRD
jgi:four helix bundle protein